MSPTYLRYSANSGLQKHNRLPRKKDRSGVRVFTPWCEQHVPTGWKIYLTKSQVGLYLLWGTHVYHGLLGKYPPTLIRFARAIAVHYMTAYFKYFSDSVATSVCFRLVFQVFWQILMAKKKPFSRVFQRYLFSSNGLKGDEVFGTGDLFIRQGPFLKGFLNENVILSFQYDYSSTSAKQFILVWRNVKWSLSQLCYQQLIVFVLILYIYQ